MEKLPEALLENRPVKIFHFSDLFNNGDILKQALLGKPKILRKMCT
jgi:hypothetical protein